MEKIFKRDRLIGKTNRELTPDVALRIGVALGSYLGKNRGPTVITSRDFRSDCRMLTHALTAGLMATSANTIDLGVTVTPITQFAIRRFGANAGVAITTCHRLQGCIHMRIFDSTGVEMSKAQLMQIFQQDKVYRADPEDVGKLSSAPDAFTIYETALNRYINTRRIAKSRFRIVVDCALGPTSLLAPSLFSKAGCDVIALNSYTPVHIADVLPNTESVRNVSKTILATNADLGVVFDVEGTRVVVLDSSGTLISPDDSVTLFLKNRVAGRNGTIVLGDSVSRTAEQIIQDGDGQRIERVVAAPGTIASRLRDGHGLFGASEGEYMFPSFGLSSDGILAALMLLDLMATEEMSLSELLAEIPRFPIVRCDVPCQENEATQIMEHIRENNSDSDGNTYSIDTLVGVKKVFPEHGWIHIRPSLRRDNLVLSAEAKKFSETDKILKKTEKYVTAILKEFRANT